MKLLTAFKAVVVAVLALFGITSLWAVALVCWVFGWAMTAIYAYGIFIEWTHSGVVLGIASAILAPWAWVVGVIHL